MLFRDRRDAGRQLARLLTYLRGQDVVVLGLPRGGVPVAFAVARELDAELDVIVVRKLGVPFQPELGMGAIGEDGVRVGSRDIVAAAGGATGLDRAARFRRRRSRRPAHPGSVLGDRSVLPGLLPDLGRRGGQLSLSRPRRHGRSSDADDG